MTSRHVTSAGRIRQPFGEPGIQDSYRKAFEPEPEDACDRSEWALQGESVATRRLRSQIQRIAPYFRVALIRGEDGSGKRAVARAIHARSRGANGPFIDGDASALANSGCDSESRRGSALATAKMLESAQGGTLYLPDVCKLSFARQGALFHFLRDFNERRFTPPGAEGRQESRSDPLKMNTRNLDSQSVGTRILAASNRDLRTLAAIGQFRQDLYTRLSAIEIMVPPLRQRLDDIPILAGWLLRWLAEETGENPKVLAEETISQFQTRLWPKNLRELERVVVQAAALAAGAPIEPRHLLALVEPAFAKPAAPDIVRIECLHEVIERHVQDVMTRCGGNKLRAAEALGISRSTLYRMLEARAASVRLLLQ